MNAVGTMTTAAEDGVAHRARRRTLPISVFVITRNEADRIATTLQSVREWADEMLVIDSGSTDDTVAIAESLGARVIVREWDGYGPQKRFGEMACRNDWLLNLDADEEIDPALADSIAAVFPEGGPLPDCAAFRVFWKMVHFGEDRPRPFALTRGFVRLYDRRRARFRDSLVHDTVVVEEGRVKTLRGGVVLHRSFRSLEHFKVKLTEYAAWQARDMVERGRRPSLLRTLAEPVVSFVRIYFLRRYFVLGRDGLEMALHYARIRKERMDRARAAISDVEA